MDNSEDNAKLAGLLKEARHISGSEVKNNDWRKTMSDWNDLMARMHKLSEKIR